MHCPDTLIRGNLTIPEDSHLLGSRINNYFFPEINNVLSKYNAKTITAFGAVPAIFKTEDFLKAKDIFLKHDELLNEICSKFYAVFSHDIFLPIIFSLINQEEVYNPDIIECSRNQNWISSQHPLVHQFRFFYPKRKNKYNSYD
jgi:hypothetical protein